MSQPSDRTDDRSAVDRAPHPCHSAEAPDRNLALELVRVTEAAAMAAGRWVGRGDKNGADGAAVNAMRRLIGTVSMRGVVVIGEGEKDDAPMLYNGEEVGSGTGPECDVAVDPIDGTTLTRQGHGQRDRGPRRRRARRDVRPVGRVLHGQARHRAGGRWRRRHPAAGRREHPPAGEGAGRLAAGPHRRAARPAAARGAGRRDPRDRRAHPVHQRRRRRRRDPRPPARHRRRPAGRHRRHAGGRSSPPARSSAWAACCRAGSGRATTTSGARRSTPGTTSTASSHATTWSPATTCSSRRPASPTAICSAASATARGTARTHSLVMRSRSGTIRLIDSEHRLAKLQAYAAVDFARALTPIEAPGGRAGRPRHRRWRRDRRERRITARRGALA